ncbi:hypothetical protein GC088_03720 [Arthrobacter sp. JZ12]|uniref:hypothetical protein n=1 Tax=Arthrobacter sp. JZ12 TaxID=2654190 RepID=UPI002B4593D8|nr:hypothetical protein [Arthrobacter sp. JZ12]WRH24285.1 hypothetical protein GC088_03720 [Arthrobacter sp. JZ12]
MRNSRWILALALTLPALGACSGPTSIEAGTAESLQVKVREIATVTKEGNVEAAMEQATALRAEVEQATASGAVTPGRAQRIQANIDAFLESVKPATQATEKPAPATTTAPPTLEAPPAAPAPSRLNEDSGSREERERDAAEEAAKEAQKRAEEEAKEAQKQAEEQQKELEKQQEEQQEELEKGDD